VGGDEKIEQLGANTDDIRVKGYVDGFKGAYVAGWAMNSQSTTCEIIVADANHKVVAKGLACIERPDLAALGAGRCNFAFSIPLPDVPGLDLIHISADGVELQRSPQRLGAGLFDGQIMLTRGRIEGWATERVARCLPPLITLVDQDDQLVAEGRAAFDSDRGNQHFAPARFSIELPDKCFGGRELRLSALANGRKFAELTCNLAIKGFVDKITADRVCGWLLAPVALQRALHVEVWRNGERVGTAPCDIPREDLRGSYPSATLGGFELALPAVRSGKPLDLTTLSFRLPGSDRELFEGPYVLAEQAALIAAARGAARVATGTPAETLLPAERTALQIAITELINRSRSGDLPVFKRQASPAYRPLDEQRLDDKLGDDKLGDEVALPDAPLNIVVPVYRNVALTRACLDSVIACRTPGDRLIMVNDASPEAGMSALLTGYTGKPDVVLLTNDSNLGFVRSVNRGISFATRGDVVLLNSDTRLFPGGLAEMARIARTCPSIGTVTALSNNATIFSYPHPSLSAESVADIGWAELAAIALERNAGTAIDMPTGHGFCLLVKREVLQRIGQLDEVFGRGYGEENDFCNRAADLGYRNVAAGGAFVEHRDSASFSTEKAALLKTNLAILDRRYPEYHRTVVAAEGREDLRRARWALDAARLARASETGTRFALVVQNNLGGGTVRAIEDLEQEAGYGGAVKLTLQCRADGMLELSTPTPALRAIFAPGETGELLRVLQAATIPIVLVHQVLGFPLDFLREMRAFLAGRCSIFYGHDFYPACPRVTMIDAVKRFCDVAEPAVCGRCVKVGGAHEASRLTDLPAGEHRGEFGRFLAAFTHVITPSENAAGYYRRAFPHLAVEAVPHPAQPAPRVNRPHVPGNKDVVVLGAIGPHKGSGTLLEVARLARLTHPELHFRVIGHTDLDVELRKLGNVTVTGPYQAAELAGLVGDTGARVALFLSGWPETYSYTLSEAMLLGFLPVVPDIGAPAERVRAHGFGVVFPFPIVPSDVVALLDRTTSDTSDWDRHASRAIAAISSPEHGHRTRVLYGLEDEVAKVRPRRVRAGGR
jgi:GT2 family glycosyltransferase/glycosyltransferase involved in cell wall biosynthesis